jgi:hypothetical protein
MVARGSLLARANWLEELDSGAWVAVGSGLVVSKEKWSCKLEKSYIILWKSPNLFIVYEKASIISSQPPHVRYYTRKTDHNALLRGQTGNYTRNFIYA